MIACGRRARPGHPGEERVRTANFGQAWPLARGWAPLIPVLVAYVILRAWGLHLVPGDEGIYFYLARRVAEAGLIPYRDFFFSHPPVHVLTAAAAFAAAGASPLVGKLIPAAASTCTVALVYATCLRPLGRAGALTAAILLAGSYDFLRSGSHFTGVNVTLLLSTAGAALAIRGRPAAAGVASAAAVLAGVYATPTALGCALLAALQGRRPLLRFAAGFVGLLALLHLALLAVAGRVFLDQVYGYHLAKPGQRWAGLATAGRVLVDNVALAASFFLALGGLAAAAARTRPTWRGLGHVYERVSVRAREADAPTVAALALLLAAGNLIVLSSLQRAFPFYFLMALPALAVCGGYAGRLGYDAYTALLSPPHPRARARAAVAAAALVCGALACAAAGRAVRHAHYPGSVGVRAKTYTWADSPLPGALDGAVRKLVWLDQREADTDYHGVRRYLWHESRRYPLLPSLAAWIEANTPADGTLFGDSLLAPWLAFLTGRRVAGEQADSNAARFRSGASTPAEVIASVEADHLAWVIARPRRGFYRIAAFSRWLQRYERARSWPDPQGGRVDLLEPPQGAGR